MYLILLSWTVAGSQKVQSLRINEEEFYYYYNDLIITILTLGTEFPVLRAHLCPF